MRIILARHGATEWNTDGRLMGRRDVVLSELGREQAEALKQKLAGVEFDCCFSSPLTRAKETAEIVCDGRCEIFYDQNLMEQYGGEFEGTVVNDWEMYRNNETVESGADIMGRAASFLEMVKQQDYESVLVVSHSGLLINLRHLILGRTGEINYGEWHLPNCGFAVFEI
ncbi:histidine phosphatase family protein [Candidatus Saccharibacteria bacterium]|nr:histidine phosphatase family protein [Candidatus Saccharibacteria bacterium]